jgi:hypothetical protein
MHACMKHRLITCLVFVASTSIPILPCGEAYAVWVSQACGKWLECSHVVDIALDYLLTSLWISVDSTCVVIFLWVSLPEFRFFGRSLGGILASTTSSLCLRLHLPNQLSPVCRFSSSSLVQRLLAIGMRNSYLVALWSSYGSECWLRVFHQGSDSLLLGTFPNLRMR